MRENYYPKNELLKKHISYVSFSQSDKEKREFFVFPNPGAAIALHNKHRFVQQQKNVFRTVRIDAGAVLLHTNRIDPVKVIDEGEKQSFTIVFRPLGVNPFFRENLSEILESAGGEHSYIDISAYGYSSFPDTIFQQSEIEKQLGLIEEFLLKRYHEKQIPLVKEAVKMLMDFDEHLSVADICKKIGTSSRNLARLFQKHIVLSPVEFRNIVQFRYSLNKKTESGSKALKDIGYESNYSDASYMIRMYKKYTGLNPSTFFDKVTIDSNYVFLSL